MEQAEGYQYVQVGADFLLLPVPNSNTCHCNSKFTMLQSDIMVLTQILRVSLMHLENKSGV